VTRREVMNLMISNSILVRELLLTDAAIQLYVFCRSRDGTSSHHVSTVFNVSIQSASARLKRLYTIGYLTRKQLTAESGGVEYVYYDALL